MLDQEQIVAMMELLGDKQKKSAPVEMSPGLVDLIHQETVVPQQQAALTAVGDKSPISAQEVLGDKERKELDLFKPNELRGRPFPKPLNDNKNIAMFIEGLR